MLTLPILSEQVVKAVNDELAAQPECFAFTVTSVRMDAGWLMVGLRRLSQKAQPLDESFEDAMAWWPEPARGTGEVKAVDIDDDEIAVAHAAGPLPMIGGKIFLYPPRYLECLRDAWRDPAWAARVNQWLRDRLGAARPGGPEAELSAFPWLRSGQMATASLPAWPISFLWGPPGTGKTTTLGTLLASLLAGDPRVRILLVSTTNSATDQALVAVDNALKSLGLVGSGIRGGCKRIGSQFVAHHYEHRKHLLPQRDPQLLKDLIEHQKNRPEQGNLAAMAAWKQKDDELRARLRAEMREILSGARLAAMTTTLAAFFLEVLRDLPPYDYLIADEASQVSLAHALSLVPLARNGLFAGDPRQLSPICQAKSRSAEEWIGTSPFVLQDRVPETARRFLDEQSRMAQPICDLVSKVFYDGRLRLCAKDCTSPEWQRLRDVGCPEKDRVLVVPIQAEGYFTQAWDGFVRHESAEAIARLVEQLMDRGLTREDIQILTPFRAQRRLIRRTLKESKRIVPVTTVHRAQGTEKRVIIFDPVQGSGKFLNRDEGFRLINVAFSRAQAQLIVLLSSGDTINPTLHKLAPNAPPVPLFCELASNPRLNETLTTKAFGYQGQLLTGTKIDGNSLKVKIGDQKKQFGLSTMLERCGDPTRCPKGFHPLSDPGSRCCE